MLELLADPEAWASLATLTVLEVVLGIDNVLFISVLADKLPERDQPRARRLGIGAALVTRLLLLGAIAWLTTLTEPFATLYGFDLAARDLVLMAGGLFLLYKGTNEIHGEVEGGHGETGGAGTATLAGVVAQIAVIDVVFSIDSVVTAVGMAEHIAVMVTAIVIAMGLMLLAAAPVAAFVQRHKSVKMLALAFLLLVGVALVADGLHFHIPKGYLYFAIAFSMGVEALNLMAGARRRRQRASRANWS